MTLADLEEKIRRRLALFEYPMRDWMVTDPGTDYDVAIVGAGKRALALALALQRERIHRVALIETPHPDTRCMYAEVSTGEGPARADFAGHAFSLPLLSFDSWQAAMGRNPAAPPWGAELAALWAAYLLWYRRFIAAPVLENIGVVTVAGGPDQRVGGGKKSISARRLVITTEADGGGPDIDEAPPARPAPEDNPPGAILGFARLPADTRARIVSALRGEDAEPEADIATSPYFELLDDAQRVLPVHLFGSKALASVGPAAAAANLVRYGVPRVLAGVSRSIFLEDQDRLYKIFQEFETAEVLGGKLAAS